MSCIKSIQRGIGNTSTTSFTINEVNPDKCIVLIDGVVSTDVIAYSIPQHSTSNYYGKARGGATVSSLDPTVLTMSNIQNTFSWQVIEFY